MKKRVRIDSSILSFIIILTGLLYQFPHLYSSSVFSDDCFDFFGLFIVFLGTTIRMVSRGYKKMNSNKGEGLVTRGPYALVRNPMYLGSFLMGVGFVLIVWPWWSLPLFTIMFYMRFRVQIQKEEEHLQKMFGDIYEKYCENVNRLIPSIKAITKSKIKSVFLLKVAWNTKEKWGLIGWFALAVLLETLQENIVFGFTDISHTVSLFLASAVSFVVIIWTAYKYS